MMSPILWSVLGALLTVLAFVLFRRVVRARAGRTAVVTDRSVLASSFHLEQCKTAEHCAMSYELALWCSMDDDPSLANALGDEYIEAVQRTTEATHRRMVAQQELDEALVAARVVLV